MVITEVENTLLGAESGAQFSPDRLYRYVLWRTWNESTLPLIFLMLNPSTADARHNDPTVERCEQRARRWGAGGLVVVNLFAYRSTDPDELMKVADPVGPENDQAILAAAYSGGCELIAGWGNVGKLGGRADAVVRLLRRAHVRIHALAVNQDGSPKHPLYVHYDVRPTLLAQSG